MIVNQATHTNEVNRQTKVDNSSGSQTNKATNTSFHEYMDEATTTVSLNDIFAKAAKEYNVPINLLQAIGKAESAFKPDATSHCGAMGIMQLMPATAKSLGVKDAYDPEQNIMGGAKLISGLLDQYNGDTKLALAAYNAGSGNVRKYGGIPPFKETQNYVVKVMNYMNQDLNVDAKVSVKSSSGGTKAVSGQESSNSVYKVYLPEEEVSVISTQDKLDQLFSMEDYMKFVDVLLKEKEESTTSQYENGSVSHTLQQININPTVANLLKTL